MRPTSYRRLALVAAGALVATALGCGDRADRGGTGAGTAAPDSYDQGGARTAPGPATNTPGPNAPGGAGNMGPGGAGGATGAGR